MRLTSPPERRDAGRRLLSVIATVVILAGVGPIADARQHELLPLLVLGDSLCVGARDNGGDMTERLHGNGWDPAYHCEIGQPVNWGIDQVRRRDRVPYTVVVALGTNGGVHEAGFVDRLSLLRHELVARGAGRIIWVDPADRDGRYESKAALLGGFAAAHGDQLVAWSAIARTSGHLFHTDRLHLNAQGKAVWVGLILEALGPAGPFPDVPPTSWFGPAVSWAAHERVTTGYGRSGLYAPHQPVTRAEAFTLLWRAEGSPRSVGATFPDVPAGSYFDGAVRWARISQLTTGVGSTGLFEPHRPMTRAEMVTMLWRHAGHDAVPPRTFGDTDPGAFYAPALSWAVERGVTTGVGSTGRFEPHRHVTRAEAITFIWRARTH